MTPRRILAIYDGGDHDGALQSASELAQKHGAELLALAAIEPPSDLNVLSRMVGRDADRLLDDLVARRSAALRERLEKLAPGRRIEPHVVVGKAFIETIRFVRDHDCDFVVKVAEPLGGMQRYLFASTDQHLLRKCPCPVWLQTAQASGLPRRVLATVDLDSWDAAEPDTLMSLNRRVVDAACAVAQGPQAEVIVLHGWEAIGEGMVWAFSGSRDARMSAENYVNEVLRSRQQAMQRFVESVRSDSPSGPVLVPRLARGAPQEVIHTESKELRADLVVMGTVARTGLSGVFIGNTAEDIINSLSCPILAVKPDGFVSPLN